MINAGTITAWLTLDTNRFNAGMESANAQLKAWKDDNLSLGEKLQSVGGALTTIGGTLTRNVTLPLAGAGAAAIKVAADFDSGMSKVQAISGATGEDLEKLRDKAREMGAKTKFSASEAADAMSYMAMAGWKTGDMLDGIEGIMNLAAASGEDLATTSDIVTDALTAFGLKAKDSGHFSDILAAASSNANTNVSLMGETFKYVAPVAGALGISAEDTAEAIGLMANAGIKGSQAGTSLRSILTRLATDAGASSKSLGALGVLTKELGVDFYDANGKVRDFGIFLNDARKQWKTLSEEDASRFAKKIAGEEGISAWLSMMNAAPEDIAKLSNAISNCDGVAQEMAETMQNNLQGKLTILKSQTEELAIGFGTELMPIAQDLVGLASSAVQKFSGLNDGTKKFIVYAGLAAAAAGPLASVLGNVTTGIGSMISTLGGAATAFSAAGGGAAGLGAAITSIIDPAGWVVLGLTAVTAAGIALYAATRDANKGARELGEAFKGAMESANRFSSAIHNASCVSSTFTATLNGGFDMSDIEQKISDVQSKITKITAKATQERRNLTKKEIKQLEDYFKELNELTEQQFEYYGNNLSALQSIAESDIEMTDQMAQNLLSEAQSFRKQALDEAMKAYRERLALLKTTYGEESEEYKNAAAQEKEIYEQRITNTNDAYSKIAAAVTSSYSEQNVAESEYFIQLKKHNKDISEETSRHEAEILRLKTDMSLNFVERLIAEQKEYKKHSDTMDAINQELVDNFDASAQQQIGTWLALVAETEASGGEISSETKEMVSSISQAMSDLPDDAKESMQNTWLGMKKELEAAYPELYAAAESDADSIINAVDKALGIASPSRVMMEKGRYTIEGFRRGLEDKKPDAERSITGIMESMLLAAGSVSFTGIGGNIVGGILKGINEKKPSLITSAASLAASAAAAAKRALGINSPSRVMMEVGRLTAEGLEVGLTQGAKGLYETASAISLETAEALGGISSPGLNYANVHSMNYGDRLDRLLDAVEKLADSQTTMEIDGRPFGRLVREYV